MLIIFSDLDGTLLDESYSYSAAQPALKLLDQWQIPLVLCTSKTRTEVEACRYLLENRHPFIVENGGALYIPKNYFGFPINAPVHRDEYAVIEFGDPYSELVQCLMQASTESNCSIRAFHQMSAEEISRRYNMSEAAARLSKQREYDEPFEILSGPIVRLTEVIENKKKRWTRGGTFYHILGANDKAHCVNLLVHFYTRIYKDVVTVGLGDGMNDAGFLNLMDLPVLMESPALDALKKAVPRGKLSVRPGPEGWNASILDIVEQRLHIDGKKIGMDLLGSVSLDSPALLM